MQGHAGPGRTDPPDRDPDAGGHLVLDELGKEYPGGITAVENLSLDLPRGDLLVLVGPSGCGKSTTLRCIAGLEEPTTGDVRIAGRSVVGETPEARDIAMVFQNYALYPHKTARENIGFGLRMTTDLPGGEIDDRVESVADTLGIRDLLEKKPGSLSGGQQQRVALGRAIVRDPEVFLLDEPLSNLDATLRTRMRTEIQQLQRDLGVTTVYVTHDQTEAMTIGDRIAVLRDGQLRQVGTPMECFHEPATRFVASFIGEPSMNFLEGRHAGGAVVGDVEYPLEGPLVAAAREAREGLVVGIRPAATGIEVETETEAGSGAGAGAEAGAGADPTFPGRVDVVEPVGERSFLYVNLDSGPTVTVAVSGAAGVPEGSRVRVRLPPERVHLFDAATGRALHHPDRAADPSTPSVPDGARDE